MNNTVSVLKSAGRKQRSPVHDFFVQFKPYTIQPIMCAPVLPGETMTHMLWQARAQSEQIKSQLIGWHLEFYYFFVKLSQLDNPQDFIAPGTGMLMNPEFDPSGIADAANERTYHEDAASPDWVQRCQDIVVREYFRDSGDTEADGLINTNVPTTYIKKPGWMDSIVLTADLVAAAPPLPDDSDNATLRELQRLQQQWEMLNMLGITEMTYEDFLAQFGIGAENVQSKKPEILRWGKYWQLPATAVDGNNGATSTVVSWKVEGRADKSRLFKEHGFIVGYAVARPKAYYLAQQTAAVSMLRSAFAWAPRMLDTQFAGITVQDYPVGEGPLIAATGADWTADTKDLFLYGDQFFRVVGGVGAINCVHNGAFSPTDKFPTTGDIDSMFVAANTTNLINMDGTCRLGIKSALRDTTPMNANRVVLGLQ